MPCRGTKANSRAIAARCTAGSPPPKLAARQNSAEPPPRLLRSAAREPVGEHDRIHGAGRRAGDAVDGDAAVGEQAVEHAPGEGAVRAAALQGEIEALAGAAESQPPPAAGGPSRGQIAESTLLNSTGSITSTVGLWVKIETTQAHNSLRDHVVALQYENVATHQCHQAGAKRVMFGMAKARAAQQKDPDGVSAARARP